MECSANIYKSLKVYRPYGQREDDRVMDRQNNDGSNRTIDRTMDRQNKRYNNRLKDRMMDRQIENEKDGLMNGWEMLLNLQP